MEENLIKKFDRICNDNDKLKEKYQKLEGLDSEISLIK